MIKLEDKLYTSTEVAEILGVSLRSVYRYIDDDKLHAEIKTATGRHRFTKQNISDFLYPNGETNEQKTVREVKQPKVQSDPAENSKKKEAVAKDTESSEGVTEEGIVEDEITDNKLSEASEEEAVDWLAKFREAAKKFEEEALKPELEVEPQEEVEEPKDVDEDVPTEPVTGLNDPVEEEPIEDEESISMVYYRSRLGGLKDIAQSLDKNARNSDIDYAFTMQAGLSLFSPIKPFSLLHAYVRSQDKEFFERILMLTPSDEENSQLCLLVSDDSSLYEEAQELHGLRVVSKERLNLDIKELDPELTKEAENILK